MEQFERTDPSTNARVEIQVFDITPAAERLDEYRIVRLALSDGRHYETAFWRDPQQRGAHWWEEPGMVIVNDLTTDLILLALDDILEQGTVDEAFEQKQS
jgi:hypothetical protein